MLVFGQRVITIVHKVKPRRKAGVSEDAGEQSARIEDASGAPLARVIVHQVKPERKYNAVD